MDWTKVEQAICKTIEERGAGDSDQRARIYAAARVALGRRQDVDEKALAQFDVLVRKIESDHASTSHIPSGFLGRLSEIWGGARQWLLFLAGIALGAGTILFIDAATVPSISVGKVDVLQARYKASLSQATAAVEFLHEVADSVIKAQSGDRKKLDATAKSFVPLAKFDPDLEKRMPASLPKGSAVILRADAFNFKILFNWPLCGTVSVSNPAMVDVVRALPNSIGCPYFGLWTPPAKTW